MTNPVVDYVKSRLALIDMRANQVHKSVYDRNTEATTHHLEDIKRWAEDGIKVLKANT